MMLFCISFYLGIQVKFKGNARTQWSEEEKADDDIKYTSKEKYFEVKKLLAGKGKAWYFNFSI